MELFNQEEFNAYIRTNFQRKYETDKWTDIIEESGGYCDSCRKDVFLKIHTKSYQHSGLQRSELPTFITYFVECPKCGRRRFSQFILIDISEVNEDDDFEPQYRPHYELYFLYSLPIKNESFVNQDIPDQYSHLKESLSEAMFTMEHGRYISSAIMFRRSLQILAKDILGAKGKTLYSQLEWLKENENLLGINLTSLFHDNSKLIKDVGNQGAHPDDEIALQSFSEADVNALHDLFLVVVNEIFIKPKHLKTIQEELIKNRKLKV